ncbi:MAG TPA: glycoside hydrolase family 88 protein [Roseiflexaceae bacterium]|nr:glycoside hydrolase family 88 protein [Roseiflexaceae bacterium]
MKPRLPKQTLTTFDVQRALHCALQTIDRNLVAFAGLFPDDTTTNNVYQLRRSRDGHPIGSNYDWTPGFWTGMLWLAYELTNDETYRRAAEQHLPSYVERIARSIYVNTHDLGFLYTLACVAPWRLTGNEIAKQAALDAAELLMVRYLDTVGIIQAWGDLDDPEQRGRAIVDSLLNMPLLYWASEVTGERRFAEAAQRHTAQLRDHIIRPDSTTYHTFYWNPETGAPLYGKTAQGYADDSCWARGQAWAIYGFILNYRYTGDETFLHTAERCADYFLDHLPDDHVAYWDLIFTDGSGEERDSSAAAIAVCGFQEMVRWLPDGPRRERYQAAANTILASLADNYSTCNHPESNALILHGVYGKPHGSGVDEANLWGDYYYLEALTRVVKPGWKPYW